MLLTLFPATLLSSLLLSFLATSTLAATSLRASAKQFLLNYNNNIRLYYTWVNEYQLSIFDFITQSLDAFSPKSNYKTHTHTHTQNHYTWQSTQIDYCIDKILVRSK